MEFIKPGFKWEPGIVIESGYLVLPQSQVHGCESSRTAKKEITDFKQTVTLYSIYYKTLKAVTILFGGEPYQEPIVTEGPSVMNSNLEIANSYRDFHSGKYRKIDYEKQRSKAW